MKNLVSILLTVALMALGACSKGKSTPTATSVAAVDTVETLDLPVIPPDVTDPNLRADFIALHFWDSMDFRDTVRSRNSDFIQQNFVNYLSILPYTSSTDVVGEGFSRLLDKACVDSAAYDLLLSTADKYLDDPNSPMLSEDIYIIYLNSLIQSGRLDDNSLAVKKYRLEMAGKNRPGTLAADFSFVTSEGAGYTLTHYVNTQSCDVMLVFFDPECDHCDEILGELTSNPRLNTEIADGTIRVLAMYSGENENAWRDKAAELPSSWTIGYNAGSVVDDELYFLPALPSIYIIGHNGIVKEKDVRM